MNFLTDGSGLISWMIAERLLSVNRLKKMDEKSEGMENYEFSSKESIDPFQKKIV